MAKRFLALLTCARGASAVEFGIVAPLFILLLFGMIAFGYLFTIYIGIQQLAAEGARASVAGLSDSERSSLAQSFIQTHAGSYAFVDPAKLTITAQAEPAPASAFNVTLAYDLSDSPIYQLAKIVPMPDPVFRRSAVVQRGGY